MADNRVRNNLGEIRRSTVVMTSGPGSVVDFGVGRAPVSAVIAGLEEWDSRGLGLANRQVIREPRLQKELSVDGFRLPPVEDKDNKDKDNKALVAVRFPKWLQCPICKCLARDNKWSKRPGRAYRYCPNCTSEASGLNDIFVIPARLVMVCARGHLDDFPWHAWVKHKPNCVKDVRGDLYLKSKGHGLSGLILECLKCGAQQSLEGVFHAQALASRGVKCLGNRPWLASENEHCDSEPRALQRGASNLYFPVIKSALSIPPRSDRLKEALGMHWSSIVNVSPEHRSQWIRRLVEGELKPILQELGITLEQLVKRVEDRIKGLDDNDNLDILQEEYHMLVNNVGSGERDEHNEFEVRSEDMPECLRCFFDRVVRVVRLREVRALRGFTRINPPGDESDIAPLSVKRLNWLPAIEVRGEGIFLEFNKEELSRWEANSDLKRRARRVHEAWKVEWNRRYEKEPSLEITPRYLLVHTFAHALMRQLSLECGYSMAALRERLYVSNGVGGMAGVLIYTATSDSDGTLGGLQRQGEADRIKHQIKAAIQAMEWCSSDPLCIFKDKISVSGGLSLAACHACVFVPETSCEQYNQLLDRAALVGLPDAPETGFFSTLLERV